MLELFNLHIGAARSWVRVHHDHRGVGFTMWLGMAFDDVSRALSAANAMKDRRRAACCLRILNWLRAAQTAGA